MNTLTLSSEAPADVFDKLMTWPTNPDLDALLEKFDQSGDMDAEITALMCETARQAFLVGYRCGRNPDLLLFAQAGD